MRTKAILNYICNDLRCGVIKREVYTKDSDTGSYHKERNEVTAMTALHNLGLPQNPDGETC